jgi:hypothetical protein
MSAKKKEISWATSETSFMSDLKDFKKDTTVNSNLKGSRIDRLSQLISVEKQVAQQMPARNLKKWRNLLNLFASTWSEEKHLRAVQSKKE